MNDLDYVKKVMTGTYKSPKFSYEHSTTSSFEIGYLLEEVESDAQSNYYLWLRQFFPNSFTAEIPPHIMEMAIDQIKANHLMRDIL